MDQQRMQEIEEKSIGLLKKFGYMDSDKIDVVVIARMLGFAVGAAEMEDQSDGFIIVKEDDPDLLGLKAGKVIGVNSKKDIAWKRFIIAHELGHYILHYDKNRSKDGLYAHREHVKGKDEGENEADFFAANLLMPRKQFTEEYCKLDVHGADADMVIALLAKNFKVTSEMVARRIQELGLYAKE